MLRFRTIIGSLLLTLALVATGAACTGQRPGDWKFGESLAIRIPETAVVDQLSYTDTDGLNYTVRPAQEGNKLYVLRVVVVNSRSNFESLQVASSTIQLLGQGNQEWNALDPFGPTRQAVESTPVDLGKYAPFVWGTFDLPQSYQLDGWLLFEVQAGTKPRGLRWDTGDTVLMDL